MNGPKVQLPSSLSQMFETDAEGKILAMRQEWAAFFSSLQQIDFAVSRSGPSASRPTSSMARYIGMNYYDTTLGLPVFLHIASTNVWHNAAGAVV